VQFDVILSEGVSSVAWSAGALAGGFRAERQGVTMHHPNEPETSGPECMRLMTGAEPAGAALLSAQNQLGDGGELHIGRALVNFPDLRISPVFFDRIVLGKAVSTVDFNCERCHPLRHL
jgi:hypothetical protein